MGFRVRVVIGLMVVCIVGAVAVLGAGATRNGMRPMTGHPTIKKKNEAPGARTVLMKPLVKPPTIVNEVPAVTGKIQEKVNGAGKKKMPAKKMPTKKKPTKKKPTKKKPTKKKPVQNKLPNNKPGQKPGQKPAQEKCSDVNQCSFVEKFKKRSDRWIAADGYANGTPFDCWWSKNKAVIDLGRGQARLTVAKGPRFGKKYVSGQLQTTKWYGYGCYEVRMKPIKQEGLISTFFTYTGKWDRHPGATFRHNEVDIEFVWKKKAGKMMMQANYFTNGRGGNEHYINLPFAAEKALHNYGFRWGPKKIEWYVDGEKVYTARKNTPKASNGNHKIMMNFWPVQTKAAGWGGYYRYQGPRTVVYDAMRFTRGSNCKIRNSF